jgi:hypothetical protein
MGLIGAVGTAASIASAAYTRRALRAQQAAAARTTDPDLEQGQLPAHPPATAMELPQIQHPGPAVLPAARLSVDSFHTGHASVATFHTAEEGNVNGGAGA